jgi:hypothetical protein
VVERCQYLLNPILCQGLDDANFETVPLPLDGDAGGIVDMEGDSKDVRPFAWG